MQPIAIFPASGALGTSTITHLLSSIPASEHKNVTLIARNPSKLPETLTQHNPRRVTASYESPGADLEVAFKGSSVLFLISYPSYVHQYRVSVQLPVIDAARRAGVRHVFYSSLGYAGEHGRQSKAVVMQAHLDTEAYLAKCAAESGGGAFSYTSIREGLYAESFPIYTGFFDMSDPNVTEVKVPHDGGPPGVAWVKRDELGEASARLIQRYAEKPEGFRYNNEIALLTGSRTWTLRETVEQVLAKTAGRPLKLVPVSVGEYGSLPRNRKVFGEDESVTRGWSTAFEGIKAGECAVVSPALKEILGRDPEEFDVTIASGGKWQQHG
ncbi:MAG: hypothetical protein Q9162_007251 [Coniocarpon cinnabarinum]